MSKLEARLEDMIKGLASAACVGISAIIGYWGYNYVSEMLEKGNNNNATIGFVYTVALSLLAASPAIAYLYHKFKK